MASVKFELIKTLEELRAEDLKTFTWYLSQKELKKIAGVTHIPRSFLEGKSKEEIVDKMVERFGKPAAVKTTLCILKKMDQNQLVMEEQEKLLQFLHQEKNDDSNDVSASVASADLPGAVQSRSLPSASSYQQKNFSPAAPSPERQLDAYEMTADRRRGHCLVISNHHFRNPEKNRDGTEIDEKNLKLVFDWLGFETQIERDCSVQCMLSLVEELSRRDHSGMDCLVVCVLSHGDRDLVYGVDENEVYLSQLTRRFSGDRCPSLVGKPKLFFIQACQGGKVQRPVHIAPDNMNITADAIAPRDSIPEGADFLLAMSTVPNYVSFRNKKQGTWFIQSLCQNLLEMVPREKNLLDILTEVNNDVSRMTDESGTWKQISQPQYTLRKSVVFPVPERPPPKLMPLTADMSQAESSGHLAPPLTAGNPPKAGTHEDLYNQICAAETEEEEMTIFYRALSSGSKEFFKLLKNRNPDLFQKLGSQFVEEHRAKLIQRATAAQLIADALHGKKMIHSELYSQITAAATSQQKMRLLYRALQAAMEVRAAFFEELQETEPYLLKDLAQK